MKWKNWSIYPLGYLRASPSLKFGAKYWLNISAISLFPVLIHQSNKMIVKQYVQNEWTGDVSGRDAFSDFTSPRKGLDPEQSHTHPMSIGRNTLNCSTYLRSFSIPCTELLYIPQVLQSGLEGCQSAAFIMYILVYQISTRFREDQRGSFIINHLSAAFDIHFYIHSWEQHIDQRILRYVVASGMFSYAWQSVTCGSI